MINLKLLFKNTTTYSKDIYEQFLLFHQKKYHFSYTAYTVMVVAFILFAIILQVSYNNFSIAILLCCGFTAFILWRYFHPIAEISKDYNSEKIQKQKSYTFKFYDRFFIISDHCRYNKAKYYKLYKVFETPNFFYLYIDKTHAFLLDKTKFKINTSSNFSKFIKKKCWWCFKNIKSV